MTRYATCPSCDVPQEVVYQHRWPELPLACFRAHGAQHLAIPTDRCPGSDRPVPELRPPQPGWRVVINTRDDGPVVGPCHLGNFDVLVADADERRLRSGSIDRSDGAWPSERARADAWPRMTGAGARYIVHLSPADAAEEIASEEGERTAMRRVGDEIYEALRSRSR